MSEHSIKTISSHLPLTLIPMKFAQKIAVLHKKAIFGPLNKKNTMQVQQRKGGSQHPRRVGLDSKKRVFFSEKMRKDVKRRKEGERWEKRLLGTGKVHMI